MRLLEARRVDLFAGQARQRIDGQAWTHIVLQPKQSLRLFFGCLSGMAKWQVTEESLVSPIAADGKNRQVANSFYSRWEVTY